MDAFRKAGQTFEPARDTQFCAIAPNGAVKSENSNVKRRAAAWGAGVGWAAGEAVSGDDHRG